MTAHRDGFANAQAAYDHAEPPDPREPETTHIDVTFTVRLGIDVDLDEYYGYPRTLHPTAEAFVHREIEGHLSVTGSVGGDHRDPIPQDDIEIYDFKVEVGPCP